MYLIRCREVYHSNPKRMWNRASHIPVTFYKHKIYIHSGKRWITRFVNKWIIGFRAGEFSWNRRLALYKAKQLRKKNKKLLKDKAKAERAKLKLNNSTTIKTVSIKKKK
jgi:ribosomal protein S19